MTSTGESNTQGPGRVVATGMDLVRGVGQVFLADGRLVEGPIAVDERTVGNLAAVLAPRAGGIMTITTKKGETFTVELASMSADPLAGRLVVHLDTKDWRTMTEASYRPESVPVRERDAALRIVDLVDEGRIVLPLSSGVLAETLAWHDPRRYEQGLTMARLSRGWQLRHSRAVIVSEIRAALSQRGSPATPAAHDPVTLAPNALARRPESGYRAPFEWAPEDQLQGEALVAMLAYIGVLTDPDPTERGDAEGWAQRQQKLTDRLAQESRDRASFDRIIDDFLIHDTIPEIAEAVTLSGISHGQIQAWIEHSASEAVTRMPSLGLFREAIREKHLDPKTKWEVNDLFDLATASCAAAYCDHFTVDRRQKETLLAAARRLGRRVSVHRTLRSLVATIDNDPSSAGKK